MKYFEQSSSELDRFLDFIEEDLGNVRRVLEFCKDNGLEAEFRIHAKSETCEESAQHSDVEIDQIVKTLVFKAGDSFVAVLCPGHRRVDEEKLSETTGSEVRMAKPGEVKDETGYVVGGVSPFDLSIPVYMQETLLEKEYLRPAAGSRVVGVKITSEELEQCTEAETVDLCS